MAQVVRAPLLTYIVNTVAAGDLESKEARVSAGIVLICLFKNIPVSAPEGLNGLYSMCTQLRFCVHVTRPIESLKQKF